MTACEGDLNAPHRNPTHDKLVGVGHGVVPEPHPSMLPWLEFRVWLWEHTFDKPVTDNSTWRLPVPVLETGSYTGMNDEGDPFILDVLSLVHFTNEELLTWEFEQDDLEYIAEIGLSISTITGTVSAGSAATTIQAWVFSGDLENGQETHAMMDLQYTSFLDFEEHDEIDPLDGGRGFLDKDGGGQAQAILDAWCPEHPCDDPPPPGDKEKNIAKANEAIAAFNADLRLLNAWNTDIVNQILSDYDAAMGDCESTFRYCVLKTSAKGALTFGASHFFGTDYKDCIDAQNSCFKIAINRRNDRITTQKALYMLKLDLLLDTFAAALDDACEDCAVEEEPQINIEVTPK